jgi:hypothetical protein
MFNNDGSGARAYTVFPGSSGNLLGGAQNEFKNTKQMVINCPDADENGNIYLYVFAKISIGTFTGKYEQKGTGKFHNFLYFINKLNSIQKYLNYNLTCEIYY